jgi:hypothetical protein
MHRYSVVSWFVLAGSISLWADAASADEVGALKVRAVFKGDVSAYHPQKIDQVAGTDCAQFHPIMTDEVQINRADTNTLRNVVIWIKSGPIDFRNPPPTEPVRMMVSQCKLSPRVVTLRENQPLFIRNEDPVKHRLDLKRTKDKEFSVMLPKPGMQISVTMEAEDPIPLVSAKFPWLKAWVAVFDHPYYAATGLDGKVSFSSFPPGDYELAAWHETFGMQTMTASVQADTTTEVDFVFEPKKDAAAEKPAGSSDQ